MVYMSKMFTFSRKKLAIVVFYLLYIDQTDAIQYLFIL